MKKIALVLLSCIAFNVHAASFTVLGGAEQTLPSNFTDFNGAMAPNPASGGLDGSTIKVFNSTYCAPGTSPELAVGCITPGTGVSLNFDADLRYTYLGTEASFENEGFTNAGAVVSFNNKTSTVGDVAEEFTLAGVIDFAYETFGQTSAACHGTVNGCAIKNGIGSNLASLWLGVYEDTADDSIILLFGDGTGDSDFDDMAIRVSVVPVPAALWLFGSALLAFAGYSTRRKVSV